MHSYIAQQLKEVAKRRNAVFVHLARNRPLSSDYEEVGVMGEWAFAEFCGLMPNTKGGKDGGKDFEVPVVFTVDVKTSKRGDVLLVEVGKVKADIYVLATVVPDPLVMDDNKMAAVLRQKAVLVGWAWSTQVKVKEPKVSKFGIINHEVPRDELRPMGELERMMGRMKRG